MSTRIRLQRHGRRKYPYYHIIVADQRSPRNGRYIERIGSYNPNTDPATIELDNDKALEWVLNGAQPSDTARQILKYKGIMHLKHLMRGVRKGSFSEEEALKMHEEWLNEKASQIESKREQIAAKAKEEEDAALKRESEVAEKRAEEIRARKQEAAAEASEEEESAEGESTDDSPEAKEDQAAEGSDDDKKDS